MSLDINTPKGRVAAEQQHRATEIVFGKFSDFEFLHTPDTDAAAVDGFILKSGEMVGVAEIKSRDSTYDNMMNSFNGEWLLTFQKLLDIQSVSRLLRLPAYGFIYLVPDEMVLAVVLTDSSGELVCKYRNEQTQTQKTVNGGVANRINSFICVRGAKKYQ